jgi:outer membrane protein assembly factor BamB
MFKTAGTIVAAAALGIDGTLYLGSYDERIYALDSTTGEKKWDTPSNAGTIGTSIAIGNSGTIYAGTYYGVLYAIEGVDGLGQTPWPKFRGGALNDGRAQAAPNQLARFEAVRFSSAGCTLKIQAAPGQKCLLQASEDLQHWTTLASLTEASGTMEFNDASAAAAHQRFYRLQVEADSKP